MLVLLASLLLAADDPAEDVKRIEGNWVAVSWKAGGRETLLDREHGVRYEIEGFQVIHRSAGGGSFTMRITSIDPTARPHRVIDLTRGEGPTSQTLPGIYKLEGDTLTICTAQSPRDRPTEFVTEPGDRRLLRVFRRAPAAP
jgi:uncharacterized protein (TIGR03067 family)